VASKHLLALFDSRDASLWTGNRNCLELQLPLPISSYENAITWLVAECVSLALFGQLLILAIAITSILNRALSL
jgi:hypothetical protein